MGLPFFRRKVKKAPEQVKKAVKKIIKKVKKVVPIVEEGKVKFDKDGNRKQLF